MRKSEEDQARIDSAANFTRLRAQPNRSEKEQALVDQYKWLASKGHRPMLQRVLDRQQKNMSPNENAGRGIQGTAKAVPTVGQVND